MALMGPKLQMMELMLWLLQVGHKFYGPRIGALYARGLGAQGGVTLLPLFFGGGQVVDE